MVEHEIKVMFTMQDLADLPDMVVRLDKEISAMNESFDEMVGKMREQVIEVDVLLELNTSILDNIKSQVMMHADNKEMIVEQVAAAEELAASLYSISQIRMFGGQRPELHNLMTQVVKLHDDMMGAEEATTKFGKALKKMGLDKVVEQIKDFGTIGGQLAFWAGAFREVAKQAGEWRTQNNAIYGGVLEISDAVREAGQEARITQEDANKAAMALRDMAIAGDSFKEATKSVGRFATETGISADATATLYKRMQVLGATGRQTDIMLKTMSGTMAKFAMNGKSAGVIIDFLNKNLYLLAERLGGGANAGQAAAEGIMLISAVARSVGMDMATVAGIFEDLMQDAMKYVVLLGSALDEADPGLQFLTIGENAGKALKMLEKIPSFLREKVAKELYGIGTQGLKEMDKFHKVFEKDIGRPAYLKLMAEVSAGSEEASKKLIAAREAYREATEPLYAFNTALGQAAAALYYLIEPFVFVAAWLLKGIVYLGSFGATSRWVARAIGVLIVVLLALKVSIFSLIGLGFGKITGAIKKFGMTVMGMSKSASVAKPSIFKRLGEGIKSFLNAFKGTASAAASMILVSIAIAIMVGAILLLAWGFKTMGLGNMVGAVLTLVFVIGALAVASQILKNASKDMIYGAVALAIMGAAMIPLALALWLVSDVGIGTILGMAIAIVAMGFALSLLSGFAGPIIIASVALGIFGVALVILAVALLIASHAFERFTQCVVVLAGIGLVELGAGFIVAGVGMLIGVTAMMAAMVIGALMVAPAGIFWAASKLIKWGFQNILEGVGGDVQNLVLMGESMYAALGGLAHGISAVVASPYYRFWRASKGIAEGMGPLMKLAFWASVLDFAGSTQKVAKSLKNLSDATKSFGPGAGFRAAAKAFSDAVWIIGASIWYYADYVENAASRVIGAVAKVTASAGMLKLFGLDEAIKTSAAITVKTDIEDKNRETADREGQTELLEGIKSALTGIHSSMSKLAGGSDTTEQLNKIKDVVTQYLPEIAESGGGLVDATNQWNSSMG